MSYAPDSEPETPVGDDTVTIRRSPRYFRFAAAGAIAGAIVALILTFAFPEPQGFNLAQVFGFLGILFVVVGIIVGAVVALLIDRASRRNPVTVVMERVEGGEADERFAEVGVEHRVEHGDEHMIAAAAAAAAETPGGEPRAVGEQPAEQTPGEKDVVEAGADAAISFDEPGASIKPTL